MLIKDIVNLVNSKLAGELLSYNEMKPYLDHAIDDINANLNTIYPAFSELDSYDTDYNMFPDRYIRSVIVPGTAWYFYVVDEEGSPTAAQFSADFARGLFQMQRDLLYNIPEEYQADANQGSVLFDLDQPDYGFDFRGWVE